MNKITKEEYYDIEELLEYGYDDIFYLFARIEKITKTLKHFEETPKILDAIKVMKDEYDNLYNRVKLYEETNNLD